MTISLKIYLDGRNQTVCELQVLANLNNCEIAALCGRSEATVRRWRRARQWPDYVLNLVAYRTGYFIWDGWEGWFIADGLLYPPFQKYGFTPADVQAVHWLKQLTSIKTKNYSN